MTTASGELTPKGILEGEGKKFMLDHEVDQLRRCGFSGLVMSHEDGENGDIVLEVKNQKHRIPPGKIVRYDLGNLGTLTIIHEPLTTNIGND